MTRLISGLIMVVIFATPIVFGSAWMFFGLTLLIVPMCIFELMRCCLRKSAALMGWIVFYGAFPFQWFIYQNNLFAAYGTMTALALGVLALGLYLFEHDKASATEVGLSISGLIYPLGLMCFWIALRGLPDGRFWVIFGLLCTFIADTGAYYTGKNLGRHKLAPKLSPKKTVEGFIGGIATAIIFGIVCLLVYPLIQPLEHHYALWLIVILSAAIAVLDLVGDLTASMFKREFNIKDMGNLIPGHGGMLDRMDGIVPVGAALYLILKVLG